jgi:hypothetical protein
VRTPNDVNFDQGCQNKNTGDLQEKIRRELQCNALRGHKKNRRRKNGEEQGKEQSGRTMETGKNTEGRITSSCGAGTKSFAATSGS